MIPVPILAGLLRADDIEDTRCVLIERISGDDQSDTSLDKQSEDLHEEVENLGGTVVKEYKGAESGASMNRDSLEEVLTLAEADKFGVLMVWKVDRLTRADPWESFAYLNKLRQNDIVLYSDSHGYFDWDEHYDFRRLIQDVVFARQWYKRIEEGRRDGCIKKLEAGKWPFGYSPYGYTVTETDEIQLLDSRADILESIFDIYIETKNRAETRRQINEQLEAEFGEELSDTRIKTVLESELCVGKLTYEGEVIKEIPELAVVDEDRFKEAQRLLESRRTRVDALDLPDPLMRATSNYGIEMLQSILSTIYFRRCRKCGGELTRNGSTERLGIPLKNFQCGDCGYQGPLLSEQDLQNIHNTLPLRCPFCPVSNDFTCEQLDEEPARYQYTCQVCDHSFITDAHPDKIERALNNPELAFNINREIDLTRRKMKASSPPQESERDEHQTGLSEFVPS